MTDDLDRKTVITAWVQEFIEARNAPRDGARKLSHEKIAAQLGCSKAHVVNISNSKASVGPDLEAAIARKLFAGSHDALFEEAKRRWRAGGEAAYRSRTPIPPATIAVASESLAEAIRETRARPETAAWAIAVAAAANADMTTEAWVDALRTVDIVARSIERASAAKAPEMRAAIKAGDDETRRLAGKRKLRAVPPLPLGKPNKP